jgi:hypothetical protein
VLAPAAGVQQESGPQVSPLLALLLRDATEEITAHPLTSIICPLFSQVGPTGCGKTEIARRLAKFCRAPFIKVEATKFTEVGYVGRDVDQIVRDLLEAGIAMTKSARRKDVEAQAGNKQAKLVRLANAYEDIIALGNAEFAVASYYRLGELHEEFAKSLFSVPTPSNYSPKEASELKSQLERSAFPLKEQSYKFYETAFTQSSEVDSLSEWTVRTYQKMATLAPDKHPDMQEITAQPGYITSKIAISSATESLAH